MADRSSRHDPKRVYRRQLDGREIVLYEPREIPLGTVRSRHRVAGHERLDLLGQRYFSDPLQYWRIADANPSDGPEELLEAGRELDIPDPT